MHDPMTVAHEIKYPWKSKPSQWWPQGYRGTFITIWHVDPEKDGSDDSCGWFPRARHGDKKVLEKIRKEFESEYHRVFEGRELPSWFNADGSPQMSSHAIALMMFITAARVHFGNYDKAAKFCKKHLFEILLFAENTFDSLHQSIIQKYGPEKKQDRIDSFSSCIYGWILRKERPWYKHPKWHFYHWKIQIHPLQQLKRFLFERCCICKKGFKWGYIPYGNWDGTKSWHSHCEQKTEIEKVKTV